MFGQVWQFGLFRKSCRFVGVVEKSKNRVELIYKKIKLIFKEII